jgi:hypothetical protein
LDVLDRQPYTYEVQRALKRTDGKPIVLTAYLNDILEVDADTFELRLEESSFSLNLHISLRCNAATVGFPLSDPQEHPFELAVVGRIVMVTKPLLQASAELDSDDGRPRVMVEHPSVVVATGECLATGRLRG